RFVAAAIVAAVLVAGALVGAYVTTMGGGGAAATTPTSAPTTVAPPAECRPGSPRCAYITSLRVDGDRYVVDYNAHGFHPVIFRAGAQGRPDDHHVHFFFDTTRPANAGSNGNPPGQWFVWDRPSGHGALRFDQANVAERGNARRLCLLVADAAEAIDVESG